MKLGILLAGRRPQDMAERFAQAREAGFSLCQLNFHETGVTRADLLAAADSMLDQGMRAVAAGCYVNPIRPDDPRCMGTCRADLDTLLGGLDVIGARRVVLWSGTHADALYEPHPANSTEEALETLRAFLTDVVRTTRARHYFLCLELYCHHVLSDEQKAVQFHRSLDPAVAERVRYVLDATNLLTPERYAQRDLQAWSICQALGPLAGVAHLKDCIMPPDGEAMMPGPGQGRLDYPAYISCLVESAAPDTPAIVRNVPPSEFAATRDYLLRLSDRWELV